MGQPIGPTERGTTREVRRERYDERGDASRAVAKTVAACRHGARCSVVEEIGTCGNGTGRMKNCTEPRGRAIQGRDVTVWTGTKAVGRPRGECCPSPISCKREIRILTVFRSWRRPRSRPRHRPKTDPGPIPIRTPVWTRSGRGPDAVRTPFWTLALASADPEPPGAGQSPRFARPIASRTPHPPQGRKN